MAMNKMGSTESHVACIALFASTAGQLAISIPTLVKPVHEDQREAARHHATETIGSTLAVSMS